MIKNLRKTESATAQSSVSTALKGRTLNTIAIFLTLAGLLAGGLWLRWRFVHAVRLYPDEFVTLLAIQQIGQTGLPVMPSGLFYEHGLLYSYLASLPALLGPVELVARYTSLLCGGLTLALCFWLGRRWFSTEVGLMAMAALAIAPTAIQWSGRARMYGLLQLLVLLTLWLAYEGIARNRARWRWAALLAFLGATLAHFVAVALAPPLALAALALRLPRPLNRAALTKLLLQPRWRWWLEAAALALILAIAFWVKRLGQPKGIDPLDGSPGQALTGLAQVFAIYSDFSLNLLDGWQAIAPFYLTLPALLLLPFALIAAASLLPSAQRHRPTLFLTLILLVTTLEMTLLVSPDRRDDKYLFMLLPALCLLGAQGLGLSTRWLLAWFKLPLRHASLFISHASLIVLAGWPAAQSLLANTGDDYAAAFATVRAEWQPGDAIMTGTPAAAAFYLGHNDFYSVQRRGGYDYRILTVADRAVDRWLASPAIRTEPALHQTLANQRVWLVLERWGLQREYYDLPFQQQLLAQTDHIADSQGIFILRSRANPQPIALDPARSLQANFGDQVRLTGYTVEPARLVPGQPLRLTLYWQALAPMAHDYTVFVHLRQPGGGTVAQADHRPLGSLYPTSLWPPGQLIRESSELHLPPALPPGSYELWVGLYLLDTGERLPLHNDTSGENALRLGEIDLFNEE